MLTELKSTSLFIRKIILLLLFASSSILQAREILRAFWENDVYFQPSDHYYSNGFRFEYWKKPDPIATKILNFLLINSYTNVDCGKENWGLSLGQNLYTPTEIERNYSREGDRNYAGWLYLGNLYSIQCGKSVLFWETSIGTFGRDSYGEQVQKFVHKFVNSEKPAGWNSQISNSYTIQNHLNYKYFYNSYFALEGSAKVGNAFTSYGAGSIIRWGNVKSSTMPGLDISESSTPPEFYIGEYYFYLRAFAWKQIYDGTLQGGNIYKNEQGSRIPEIQQNSYLLDREKAEWKNQFVWDWNQEKTFTGRYLYFYQFYQNRLPDNLPLNLILFHTLFNGNSRMTEPTKNMLLFVLRDKDWNRVSIEEKLLYTFAIANDGSARDANLLYILSLKYLVENIAKDSSLTLEQIYLFNKMQERRDILIQPRSVQGKLQFGFAWTIKENLFFQFASTISTPEFYPEPSLPQIHKWGGLQLAYRY